MIIPIIQTDSAADVQAKLDAYAAIDFTNDAPNGASKPTHFQIDINDGLFTPHFSVQPSDLREINWHGFTHEYHLLVDHPDEYLGDVAESGATTVIAQIEHMPDRPNFIDTAKQLGLQVGFALDFYTPIDELTTNELHSIDLILLMAYKAGHSGPQLNPNILPKIHQLRQAGFTKPIEIDGGVNPDNAPSLIAAGATHLAVNSALWHNDTIKQNLIDLLCPKPLPPKA